MDNIYKNIFNNYYSSWKQDYIIERSDWIIPCNYEILRKYCPNEIKIVVLVRDIIEIICSFINLARQHQRFFLNQDAGKYYNIDFNLVNDQQRIDTLMHEEGYVMTILKSIDLIVKYKYSNILFVEYNRLIDDPTNTINEIYSFYNIPFFQHSFNNLKQLNCNKVNYNDYVYGGPLHEIVTTKVERINNSVVLPHDIIKKYSNLETWKENII